jgi:23S rRNA G2445 N2-methylase RlmL
LDEQEGMRGDLGELFRNYYGGWKISVLSGGVSPSKGWGMRPSRTMPVFNGNLSARILVFEPPVQE